MTTHEDTEHCVKEGGQFLASGSFAYSRSPAGVTVAVCVCTHQLSTADLLLPAGWLGPVSSCSTVPEACSYYNVGSQSVSGLAVYSVVIPPPTTWPADLLNDPFSLPSSPR